MNLKNLPSGKKKEISFIFIISLALFLLLFISFNSLSNNFTNSLGKDQKLEMDQFSVWVNNSDYYIKAKPHTTFGGYVYVDVINRMSSGYYNIVFGFDNITIPAEIAWQNETINKLGKEKKEWKEYGSKKFKKTKYKDKTLRDKDTPIAHYLKDIYLEQNKLLKLRFLVPPSEKGYNSKYNIAFYPSSYKQNLDKAYDDSNFFELDPWVKYGDNDIFLIYSDDGETDLTYRNGSLGDSWSGEGVFSADGDSVFIDIVKHPFESWSAIAYQMPTATNDSHVIFWDGEKLYNDNELFNTGVSISSGSYLAVEFESQSGDLHAIYRNYGAGNITLEKYNGTGWNYESAFDTDQTVEDLSLYSNPIKDELIILYTDSSDDLWAVVWNGTAFDSGTEISTNLDTNGFRKKYDGDFYQDGSYFLGATSNDETDNDFKYFNWNGSNWTTRYSSVSSTYGDVEYINILASEVTNVMYGFFGIKFAEAGIFTFNETNDMSNITNIGGISSSSTRFNGDIGYYDDGTKPFFIWGDSSNGYYRNGSFSASNVVFTSANLDNCRADYTRDNYKTIVASCAFSGFPEKSYTYIINTTDWVVSETESQASNLESRFAHDIQINEYINIQPIMNASRLYSETDTFSSPLQGFCNSTGENNDDLSYYYEVFKDDKLYWKSSFSNYTGDAVIEGTIKNVTYMQDADQLFVEGNYTYVTSRTVDSLTIINTVDKSNPVIEGFYANSTSLNNAQGIIVRDDIAYIAADTSDAITILNVSDKNNPTQISSLVNITYLDGAFGVDLKEDYLFVASNNSDSLTILNVSDVSNPNIIGAVKDSADLNGATEVIARGDYAYIAAKNNRGLTILNISDKTDPTVYSTFVNTTSMGVLKDVAIQGDYAYMSAILDNFFVILNITNKSNPYQVAAISDATAYDNPNGIEVRGNFVYSTSRDDDSLIITNVTDKSNPAKIKTLKDTNLLNGAMGVSVYGSYAYIVGANYDGLTIVNIANGFQEGNEINVMDITPQELIEMENGTWKLSCQSHDSTLWSDVLNSSGLYIGDEIAYYKKEITQAIDMSESMGNKGEFERGVNQILDEGEIMGSFGEIFRRLSQKLDFSDNVNRILNNIRRISQEININELINRLKGFFRISTAGVDLTEQIDKQIDATRGINQALNFGDTTSRLTRMFRDVSDTFGISDAIFRLKGFFRSTNQGIDASDAIDTGGIFGRVINQAGTFTALSNPTTFMFRDISDNFDANTLTTRVRGLFRTTTDSFTVTSITDRTFLSVRTVTDFFILGESVDRIGIFFRLVTGNFNIDDSINATYIEGVSAYVRSVVQSIDTIEMINSLTRLFRNVEGELTLESSVNRLIKIVREIDESFILRNSINRIGQFTRIATDSFNINNSATAQKGFYVAISQAINLEEAIERSSSFFRAVGQAIQYVIDIFMGTTGTTTTVPGAGGQAYDGRNGIEEIEEIEDLDKPSDEKGIEFIMKLIIWAVIGIFILFLSIISDFFRRKNKIGLLIQISSTLFIAGLLIALGWAIQNKIIGKSFEVQLGMIALIVFSIMILMIGIVADYIIKESK